jgi:hypothetical protein
MTGVKVESEQNIVSRRARTDHAPNAISRMAYTGSLCGCRHNALREGQLRRRHATT